MKRLAGFGILLTFCILAAPVYGAGPVDHPGFIDLSFVQEWAGDNVNIEVNISKQLLQLAGLIASTEDSNTAKTIKKLEHISVRVLEDIPKEKQADFLQWSQKKTSELRTKGWEPVASVRESGKENISVMMLMDKNKISGIFVTVMDTSEAVFVNIVGDIDFDALAGIGKKFDIPGLDSIKPSPAGK